MDARADDGLPARLSCSERVPGPALSEVVDFLIPGLEGLHFVAYGSTHGTVVVSCARQVDHIGSAACHEYAEQQQLQTLLVLDLQRPSTAAAALSYSARGGAAAPAPEPGAPLSDAVLHVAFGGGPHLLLAACTHDTLAVLSLEGLATHLFQHQASGGGPLPVAQQPLWQQLAAVHCGHGDVLAISWTQQLDGILASSADGLLTMWHLRPLAPPSVPEQQPLALDGTASGPPAAALRAAWSVQTPIPQRLVCAGVSVYAPSATAAGQVAAAAASPAGRRAPAGASPGRDGGAADGERYACVWWPQAREQRQRHYAGGMPAVGQEKLRHNAAVIGLQWSPGVLQKDALALAGSSGGGGGGPGGASPGGGAGSAPSSPSSVAAAAAAADSEDHPALMTLSEDGTVRVWVETVLLTESSPLPSAQPSSEGRGSPTPPRSAPKLQRRSPGSGSGSPGAAPSSPRDVRAAAAAAAALGAAAPDITSYFCMALLIDAKATAAGAAAAAAAGAADGGGAAAGAAAQPPPHVALWARHTGPLLLHKQQRRTAAPVLWLFTAAVERSQGGGGCRLLLHLHAVRGLAAIVMSAGYGGSLSSTSGGSSSTRPAAVLWGQHSWELPPAAAGMDPAALLHRLCCWVSDEEGYPLLHTFTSASSAGAPGGASSGCLVLAGRTFSTVQQDGPSHMQVHKQLAVASSWQAVAVAHEQPIVAFAAHGSGSDSSGLLASCDGSGHLLLWDGPHLRHLAAVPAAAVGSTAALAWLPLALPQPAGTAGDDARRERWLAVGSGSMLQCYSIGSRQPAVVATTALPAGCSAIKSLHTCSDCGSSSGRGSNSSGRAHASSCVLVAVCSSSTGRGSVLCAWRCSTAAAAASAEAPAALQVALIGTAALPAAAPVTAAVAAGSSQLLVGAGSAVLLLSIDTAGGSVRVQPVAAVEEDGPAAAVAADEGCLHLASACGSSVSVWSATPGASSSSGASGGSSAGDDSGGSAAPSQFMRTACVQVPPADGRPAVLAWLCHTAAPCLAVGTTAGSLLLLSAVRHSQTTRAAWQWVARLPPTTGVDAGISCLAAASGCASVVAALGHQLLRLTDAVLLPTDSEQEGGRVQLLGRLLLDLAGPLPQYHPTFLAALLLSGKRDMAAAVLQRLAAWLAALREQAESAGSAAPPPLLSGSPSASGAEQTRALFSGLPLAEMVDRELAQIQKLLEKRRRGMRAAAAPAAEQGPPVQQPSSKSSSIDAGMLDMGAFGFGAPPAAEPAPQQQQQQPAAAAAAGGLDSGMLDMGAFGFGPPAAEPAPQQQQQQPAAAAGGLDSGMLDMAAFGFGPPPVAEPAPQQQQQPAAAAGSLDSGMLDMGAFGFGPPPVAGPAPQQQQQQQPAAGCLDSGMLDMGAFGFGPPAAEPAPQQQQQPAAAAGGLDSGMLDMGAFGFGPPPAAEPAAAPQQPPQPQQPPVRSNGLHAAQHGTPPAAAVAAAGLGTAAHGSGRLTQPLEPPAQQLLPAKQLLPVAAECCRQLQELLLAPPSEEAPGDGGSSFLYPGSQQAYSPAAHERTPAAAIPGLSLKETAAVLAIAEAFSQLDARSAGGDSSHAPVDAAAAQVIAAVSLACAIGGQQQQQQAGSGEGGAAPPPQQRVTVMNAAGVAYTLAPSAVAGGGSASSSGGSECGSIGQRWGLLPGLDASAVLWALLSGTEEQLLQQALQRLQQQEAARSVAAAAAESADAAAFLSARAATKPAAVAQQPPTWAQLRQLGCGFWLRGRELLASTVERLAKQQFAARRNADDCALLYCALGKRSVLQGLYRSTQNRKLAEFLGRDFEQEQHRQAAQKNAFVLLGQHRHELAAAFFILGGCPHEAVGVASHELADPQLALLLCRLLFGGAGSSAELGVLQQLGQQAEGSASADAAVAAAACCWLQADASAAVERLLGSEQPRLSAAAAAEHAAQLLPLLHLLLTAAPPTGDAEAAAWQQHLQRCLWALAAALGRAGLHALAVQAAAAAQLDSRGSSAGGGYACAPQALLCQHLLAEALLPVLLEQQEYQWRHLEADGAYQLELLQQRGIQVEVPAVLSRLRRMRRSVLAPGAAEQFQQPAAPLSRQHSSVGSVGGSSYRSRESEPHRWAAQRGHGTAVVAEGTVLFRVDHEKLEAVACCPLMSPDVLGRPVVVASHRLGLVEGQLHVVAPEPLSPLIESPLEEEQSQRGGVFSRLLSQLFDSQTWQQDPTWHHGTAEFDVVGSAADVPVSITSPHGSILTSGVLTSAMAAHPSKQLYVTGCQDGLLHLFQFGEQRALATYTPVPGSELASISHTFSGLLSFSQSFKTSKAAPRLANWGKAAAVKFSPSGESFAAVGEGGVVATWRLDAPSRQADADGCGCSAWWHQALSKQGCAVDFVGGSSSVLVVGGRSLPAASAAAGAGTSNLSVWDTTAPVASSCVGRLTNHQATVTAVSMLPGGWLLVAGDAEGSLSCTDLRMMGGSSGPRLLWSVKAARGALTAIAAIPSAASPGAGLPFGGSAANSALLATGGADGAVRVWRGADGRLVQSLEAAHYSSRHPSSRRSSQEGGAQPLTPPGAHPLPVTGLAACEEGLVSCGHDGCVRLYTFT